MRVCGGYNPGYNAKVTLLIFRDVTNSSRDKYIHTYTINVADD